ncbi:DUF4381 domain-containing protein [Gammaproteobacteria bacterium]|nr:DUF4381 domain-containing protein [Gammaproteobacteria bacterium]
MSDRGDQAVTQASELFGSDRMWGLKELPLPELPSWAPQTPAWLVLLAVIVVALIAIYRWQLRKYRAQEYRRSAFRQISAMRDNDSDLSELPRLLRAVAIESGSREAVVPLQGQPWIAWLNRSARQTLFNDDDAALMQSLAYASPTNRQPDRQQVQRLIEAALTWVKVHRA